MTFKTTLPFVCLLLLTACESHPSYPDRLAMRPMPSTPQQIDTECQWIRGEVARMQSASAASASSQFALAFQAMSRNNIAALEGRAAAIGCRAAFSSQSNQIVNHSPTIQQCIEACLANTDRTSEACFDACNK